jgi:hypothetical protein
MDSFRPRPLYRQGKVSPKAIDVSLGESDSRSGRLGEQKNLNHLQESIRSPFAVNPAAYELYRLREQGF